MIDVEELGVSHLVRSKDAGVKGVSLDVQLQARGMVEVGEVQLLLSRHVGQVSLGLVNGLRKAEVRKVFLIK